MEHVDKSRIIAPAWALWDAGMETEAGKVLYERIARKSRPVWAANILLLAYELISPVPEIGAVITFARFPQEWERIDGPTTKKAHFVFDNVRRVTLLSERGDQLFQHLCLLAENVAKVTYNAYGFAAPFDHDAGWWIAACAKGVVTAVADPDFTTQMWQTIANEEHITLESPTRCNPYCPTCHHWTLFSDIVLDH